MSFFLCPPVSLFLIFGWYGSETLEVGAREERLINPGSWLVKSIEISPNGPMPPGMNVTVLTFPKRPPLSESFRFSEDFADVAVRSFGYEVRKSNSQKNDFLYFFVLFSGGGLFIFCSHFLFNFRAGNFG